MNAKIFRWPVLTGAGLGLVFLALLAGCADTPAWSGQSRVPSAEQLQAVRGSMKTYVYFASYQIYYESTGQLYTYRQDGDWVTRPQPPPGVAVELLNNSPCVAMNFDDSPEWHHAAVLRSYPPGWGRSQTIMASVR